MFLAGMLAVFHFMRPAHRFRLTNVLDILGILPVRFFSHFNPSFPLGWVKGTFLCCLTVEGLPINRCINPLVLDNLTVHA